MNKPQSARRRSVAADSSRLQHQMSERFSAEPGPRRRPPKVNSFFQPALEVSRQRLEADRSPFTGLSRSMPNLEAKAMNLLEQVNSKIMKSTQRMHASVLESWINSTLADAEEMDIPGCIMKPQHRLPLTRYGVDRATLLAQGLDPADVDKVFRSLFVYSIGFYQMILKTLEHCTSKYTIVAGLWKVFAILLEYCCHLDYQMVITTINIEKNEEVKALKAKFKVQMQAMADSERKLSERLEQTRQQLQETKKDLHLEVLKREELEDELLQRGSGHEEEVGLRLRFESKLNSMFARQRDMELKSKQLAETNTEQQRQLDQRLQELNAEKRRNVEQAQIRVELEQEIKRLKEKLGQIEGVHTAYEDRLTASYGRLEEANAQLSKLHTQYNQTMNDLAQKNVEVDDLRCELQIFRSQVSKLETTIVNLKNEKDAYAQRVHEVDNIFHTEVDKYKHFEQEYARVKEGESSKAVQLAQSKETTERLQRRVKELEKERDALKIHLDTSIEIGEEYKVQAKLSQERIEEMNKGRRIVEEHNSTLEAQLRERNEDLKDIKQQYLELKRELERFKAREVELDAEVSALKIKLESKEKQFETNKETMMDKIKNLTDILAAEKKIRENWIYRYEEEQKIHNASLKELTDLQDKLNEAQLQLNTVKAELEDAKIHTERLSEKQRNTTDELLELRSAHEDLNRKHRTSEMLLEAIDQEHADRLAQTAAEVEELRAEQAAKVNALNMYIEDLWEKARINLEKYKRTAIDLRKLTILHNETLAALTDTKNKLNTVTMEFEGTALQLEDFRHATRAHEALVKTQSQALADLHNEHTALQTTHSEFLAMVPPALKDEPNPFAVLTSQVSQLQGLVSQFQLTRDSMKDADTQIEVAVADGEAQTDPVTFFTDKGRRDSGSLASQYSGKDIQNAEFPLRKRVMQSEEGSRRPSRESARREDATTPVNMKSVYGESSKALLDKGHEASLDRLPDLSRRKPPRTAPGPPSDVKRYIRQANSRRRGDADFM